MRIIRTPTDGAASTSDEKLRAHLLKFKARMAAESRAKTAALNREIEERRRISEREQLLIAAVESSNDAIITETLDGVITGWNPAAERLFGYTAYEVIGNNVKMLMPSPYRESHDAYLERYARTGDSSSCADWPAAPSLMVTSLTVPEAASFSSSL